MRIHIYHFLLIGLIVPVGLISQKKLTLKDYPVKSAAEKSKTMQSESSLTTFHLPDGIKKLTTVEGITEYSLKNGLRVLLFPDASKQTITVNVTYEVGSRHEGYGETGMAHLLEHMVFKGTPRHKDIPNELSSHGARPNGTTWYDRTNYFETFSATEENLKWALDLESDRMINSFIAKEALVKEMTVVRNEFESGENNPAAILMERVMSTAYLWHNYGKSTIGARSDIEKVPIERLQAFYRKYYQPDNAVLVVAGKIDEAKTLQFIDEYFGKIPKPTRELIKTYTEEPTQDGERSVILRRTGDVQVVSCSYHIPPGSHPDAVAVEVLVDILTNEPSGRLYKALVETKKASSQSGYSMSLKEPGFAYFEVQVRKENSLEEAKNILLSTLDEIANNPPSKAEVERSINKELKNFKLSFNNTEYVGRTISEFIGMGDWRLAYINRDILSKVTPEDVQRVALAYFKPSNRTVGQFIPDDKPSRAEIPSAPDIASLVNGYMGQRSINQGEDFDPSPMNIEKRTHRKLEENTIKFALLPKATKGNLVNATLTLRFGDENSLKGKNMASSLTAEMLDKGTKLNSRQELKDQFDKLNARVNFMGNEGALSVFIQTTNENLPSVISKVSEILKQPSFSEKEFELLKNEALSRAEEQKSDPQSLTRIAIGKYLRPYPKGDIRYINSMEEEIEEIKNLKLEDVKKFHSDFYGTNNATIAIVGDFEELEVKQVLSKEFGKWKSSKPYTRIESKFFDVPKTDINIETPDKANAVFLAGCSLPIKDNDTDYAAMLMGNYILGGGFLNSRLATRIRQKEGLSYGVGSQFSADAFDKSGSFMTFAIMAPENRNKVEEAFKEEISRLLKDGFTEQELKDAKTGMLQSRKVNRSQDNTLSRELNSKLFQGRTFDFDEETDKKLENLTVEQLNASFRKHIKLDKISFAKGGDFANKLKKP